MPRKVKTKATSPARSFLEAALTDASRKELSTWRQFEPTFLAAMQEFDREVAAGRATSGDINNGKGDAFNDFLVTLLEACSGKQLHTRPDVPGLSFPNHMFDIAYPDQPAEVELVVETKATGVPRHPGNTKQKNPEGRGGSADTEKRIKEASFKNIDVKAYAAAEAGRGAGPTNDLGSWMRQSKPRCYLLMSVRVRSPADFVAIIRHCGIAGQWFDRCGLYCYGWDSAHKSYESKPVPAQYQLHRVMTEICSVLRNLP